MSRMFTEKEIFDFYSKHNISVKENEKEFSRGSIVKPFEKLDWPITTVQNKLTFGLPP